MTAAWRPKGSQKSSAGLAYLGVFVFILVYCSRPGDWLPGAGTIPFAKISAALAVLGFAASLLGGKVKFSAIPREVVLLILLFLHLVLTIPFSIWMGGSFDVVFGEFWKVVFIALVIATAVKTMQHLEWLVLVQVVSVSLMAALTAVGFGIKITSKFGEIRQAGVLGGVFDNPNDFAFNIALMFPFCFAFALSSRGVIRKTFWVFMLALCAKAVLSTYSRGGFLAFMAALAVCLWDFGIEGRRRYLMGLTAVGMILLFGLLGPAGFFDRMSTITTPDEDVTGSSQTRKDVLIRSLEVTATHPLFGVGPGNFPIVSVQWLVSHNCYTQLSAEAGIPAIWIFLLLLRQSFRSLRSAKDLSPGNEHVQLLAGALRASLAGFCTGALFASVAYHFFPYWLITYAGVLHRLTEQGQEGESPAKEKTASAPLPPGEKERDGKPGIALPV